MERVCSVLKNDSDFFVPDCASHINIIDGETEGLYGWLALNYLKDMFDALDQQDESGKA